MYGENSLFYETKYPKSVNCKIRITHRDEVLSASSVLINLENSLSSFETKWQKNVVV